MQLRKTMQIMIWLVILKISEVLHIGQRISNHHLIYICIEVWNDFWNRKLNMPFYAPIDASYTPYMQQKCMERDNSGYHAKKV